MNEERAVARIVEAEELAERGSYESALRVLLGIVAFSPPPLTLERARQRYVEFLSDWLVATLESRSSQRSWRSFAIANFAETSSVDGCSIRDRIFHSFQSVGLPQPRVVHVSELTCKQLQQARFDEIAERQVEEIEAAQVDALVFGVAGGEFRSYTYDVRRRRIEPLVAVQSFGVMPQFPTEAQTWSRLPAKRTTSRGLRVAVWTEQASYRPGDEIVVKLRCNRDCFVTLLDLQTSGNLYLLLPNAFRGHGQLQKDRVISIPAEGDDFAIAVRGPIGIEGLKAIATMVPIELSDIGTGGAFAEASGETSLQRLNEAIDRQTARLDKDDWDIAEWTFEIQP